MKTHLWIFLLHNDVLYQNFYDQLTGVLQKALIFLFLFHRVKKWMKTFNLIIIMHYFVGFMFLSVAMSFSNTSLFFSLLLRRRWYVALWNYEERRAVYFIKNSKDTFKSLWMNGNNSLLKVFNQLLGLHGFFVFQNLFRKSLFHILGSDLPFSTE